MSGSQQDILDVIISGTLEPYSLRLFCLEEFRYFDIVASRYVGGKNRDLFAFIRPDSGSVSNSAEGPYYGVML